MQRTTHTHIRWEYIYLQICIAAAEKDSAICVRIIQPSHQTLRVALKIIWTHYFNKLPIKPFHLDAFSQKHHKNHEFRVAKIPSILYYTLTKPGGTCINKAPTKKLLQLLSPPKHLNFANAMCPWIFIPDSSEVSSKCITIRVRNCNGRMLGSQWTREKQHAPMHQQKATIMPSSCALRMINLSRSLQRERQRSV